MMLAVLLIFTLCMTSYVAAVITEKPALHKLVFILVLALVFFIARQEYMIHRPAAWVKTVQNIEQQSGIQEKLPDGVKNWEEWKDGLLSTRTLLPLLDVLAGIAMIYIIFCSGIELWENDWKFVCWSLVGLIAGILACIAGAKLAGK